MGQDCRLSAADPTFGRTCPELYVLLKRRARFRDCFGLGRVHQDREVMGQQRWLDRHLRQSHIQNIGGRCPDTLGTLSASFKGAAPTAWARRSTPPCKPNATAHEPSRKTLAAFACERSTGAATLLRLRQTLGLGLGVADDLRSISRSSALVFAGAGFRGLTSNAA